MDHPPTNPLLKQKEDWCRVQGTDNLTHSRTRPLTAAKSGLSLTAWTLQPAATRAGFVNRFRFCPC
eukprot:3351836-Rhodomonas_salina.1